MDPQDWKIIYENVGGCICGRLLTEALLSMYFHLKDIPFWCVWTGF